MGSPRLLQNKFGELIMNDNIIVAGDVHGEWEILSKLIKDTKPELVISALVKSVKQQ